MALTKVSGHIIDQPFDVGIITATNQYVSGIGTFGNIRVLGDLQIDGTTTTLDTVVTEVDRLEVGANNNTVGLAVTQSGSGDILSLYDGSTEVFSVADGGNVFIGNNTDRTSFLTATTNNLQIDGGIVFEPGSGNDVEIYNYRTTAIKVGTGGTEKLRIDGNGHMGLGVTPSAWPSNGDFRGLQIGTGIAVFGRGSGKEDRGGIAANYYHTGSAQKYIGNGHAGRMYFEDGSIVFSNAAENSSGAGAAMTLTERLRITEGGNVQVNGGNVQIDDNGEFAIFEQDTSLAMTNSSKISMDFASNIARIRSSHNGSGGNAVSRPLAFFIGSSEKVRITSAGNIGIGTDSPSADYRVTIKSSTSPHSALLLDTTESNYNTNLYFAKQGTNKWTIGNKADSDSFRFVAGSTERLRIDGDGRLLVGTNTAVKNANRLSGNKIALVGTGDNFPSTIITSYATADADAGPIMEMQKSRGETDGSMTVVANNDRLGNLQFLGSDGTNFIRAAAIAGYVDGTPGTNDMPGRLIFSTTADSASVPTERLRITSDGKVRIPDGGKFVAGASDDLQIFHSSGENFIRGNSSASPLYIDCCENLNIRHLDTNGSNSETMIRAVGDGAVELFYNNSKKFETTATGAKVTGALEVTQEYPSIRPTLDFNFAATKTLDRRITFTRDSGGTFTDENGLVKYASNNVPRFDHDPTTGESLGLLIEQSSTNLITYSQTFSNWTVQADASITLNQGTAPDGTNTAVKLIGDAAPNSGVFITGCTVSSSANNTKSIYLRSISGTATCQFKDPVSTVTTLTCNLTTTWQRFSFSETQSGGQAGIWIDSIPSGGILAWGAQVENKPFLTSYIPTNGSAVTRAQDTPLITGTDFTDFYNQSEGTLVLSADVGEIATGNQAAVVFEDTSSTATSFIAMGYNTGGGGSGHVSAWYNSSGATSAFTTHNVGMTANTEFRQSFAYKLNDFSSVVDGGTPLTDNSGGISSLIDRVRFGQYYANGMTTGHIRQFKYYNKRLPDAQLQGLTAQ
jgi:hypothetical protein